MRIIIVPTLCAFALSVPAFAGDQVIYGSSPDWVEPTTIDAAQRSSSSPVVLIDQQARINDGQLWTHQTTAVALDSPEALTRFGTVSASWLPDKGDLIVHSVELIRDAEVIDLIDGGAEFEVIRRERGLEARLLNGVLTATMTVPGARVGDILRLSYSTTLSDQAMRENVQWQSPLVADPFPLESGRVSVSWPSDMDVSRVRIGDAGVTEPELADGFYTWSVQLPIEEPDPKPTDAPLRYLMGDLMQVTTYQSWSDVSQSMVQHYDPTDAIAPGGELADRVAEIAGSSDDPLERTALALQLVQDEISYLLNGLNGGNYLPQSPQETWENRFGDCKAKSLLLLAILQELGVEGELVLVRTQGGDALPSLAPMPGNFDHMIVRADIDGKNYWLDGTTAGTRLPNIDTVPRFFFALPLREEGADLMPLDLRPPSAPDQIVRLSIDQSAGIRVPSLIDVELEFRGPLAAQWRVVAEQDDADVTRQAVYNTISNVVRGPQLVDRSVTFDPETGIAIISARGLVTTGWSRDRSQYELEPPAQAAKNVGFSTDRARAAWRDIPLRLNGPVYYLSELDITLPDVSGQFEVDGSNERTEIIGGVELNSNAALNGNRFTMSQSMRSVANELNADEISAARRSLARFDRALPVLRSPTKIRELWEYFGDDRALLEEHAAVYRQAIEEADDDDTGPLINRARFRHGVFDHAGALEDVEAAYEILASRPIYLMRAALRLANGHLENALEDWRLAEDLQPDGSTYSTQINLLALLGRPEEGLELADEYRQIVDDVVGETNLEAMALGWAGEAGEGLELLESLAAQRPGDGRLLNAICWQAGIWDEMNAERLETCVAAVEKSEYSAQALDSRALAHFRMGDMDAALGDINAALLAEPSFSGSRLLRGIIRIASGDRDGREDVDLALAMRPSLRARYSAWGLEF
ncbi:MAG: DUF3857 domain-containing protein [Erythrobacter sp.]